jgi:hypothetical protein
MTRLASNTTPDLTIRGAAVRPVEIVPERPVETAAAALTTTGGSTPMR